MSEQIEGLDLEDDLTEVIDDSLGPNWTPRDGAKAVLGAFRAMAVKTAPAAWEDVATEVTEVVAAVIEPLARKAADDIYERLMETAQDYLANNLRFNLSSRLGSAEGEAARLRKECFDIRAQRIALAEALNNLISAASAPSYQIGYASHIEAAVDEAKSTLAQALGPGGAS